MSGPSWGSWNNEDWSKEVTKIMKINTFWYHIDDKRWLRRNPNLDKSSSQKSFFFQCFSKFQPKEVCRMTFYSIRLNIAWLFHFSDLLFYKFCGQIPLLTLCFSTLTPTFCLIILSILMVQEASLQPHWRHHAKDLSGFQ